MKKKLEIEVLEERNLMSSVFTITGIETNLGEEGEKYFEFRVDRTETGTVEKTLFKVARVPGLPMIGGRDFYATYGLKQKLTFGVGESSKIVRLEAVNDFINEQDESFYGVVAQSRVQCLLRNYDKGPSTFRMDSVIGQEGTFVFGVYRTGDLSYKVDLNFGTIYNIPKRYTAKLDDFLEFPPAGILSFDVGESYKEIVVKMKQDGIVEGEETFAVQLFGPSAHKLLNGGRALGTVLD